MILYFVEEFTGRMNVELSFLVDGDMYKAVMQKEKSCTELEKSELVTIRLFEQDRSIFLRFTEENGKVDLRYNCDTLFPMTFYTSLLCTRITTWLSPCLLLVLTLCLD